VGLFKQSKGAPKARILEFSYAGFACVSRCKNEYIIISFGSGRLRRCSGPGGMARQINARDEHASDNYQHSLVPVSGDQACLL